MIIDALEGNKTIFFYILPELMHYHNSSLPLNTSELLVMVVVGFGYSCQSQGGISQVHLSMNLGQPSVRILDCSLGQVYLNTISSKKGTTKELKIK